MPDEPGHTAVMALGGNALAPSGAHSTITDQFRPTRASLAPVVDLALDGWRLGVVHATAGRVGSMIRRSPEHAPRRAGSGRDLATAATQAEVAPAGPALARPVTFSGHEPRRGREALRGEAGTTIVAA